MSSQESNEAKRIKLGDEQELQQDDVPDFLGGLTEHERVLRHEDIRQILELACLVKATCEAAETKDMTLLNKGPTKSQLNAMFNLLSAYGKKQKRKQKKNGAPPTPEIITRGMCRRTDAFIDETLYQLTNQLKKMQKTVRQMILPDSPKKFSERGSPKSGGSPKKNGEAIAVKYSKAQTDILTQWMIEHRVRIELPTDSEILFTFFASCR
jgi:hypothetical protein